MSAGPRRGSPALGLLLGLSAFALGFFAAIYYPAIVVAYAMILNALGISLGETFGDFNVWTILFSILGAVLLIGVLLPTFATARYAARHGFAVTPVLATAGLFVLGIIGGATYIESGGSLGDLLGG